MKELSERDDRELEADEERRTESRNDVNVAWGQTLYNITSGKPAAVAEAPQSAREGDYMEKIAQIQRAWDKELQAKRDDLSSGMRVAVEMALDGKSAEVVKIGATSPR